MDREGGILDYKVDEYSPEELDKCIEELSRKKAQAVTAPSIAEKNGETLPELDANQSNSSGATELKFQSQDQNGSNFRGQSRNSQLPSL